MIDNFFAEILRGVSAGRIVWDPVNGTLNGLDYDDYVYPGHAIWWLARGLEFFRMVNNLANCCSPIRLGLFSSSSTSLWWICRRT